MELDFPFQFLLISQPLIFQGVVPTITYTKNWTPHNVAFVTGSHGGVRDSTGVTLQGSKSTESGLK